jgi:hypothetical protein
MPGAGAVHHIRLGKARGEHNESGVRRKAEVLGALGHFRVGPQADSVAEVSSDTDTCGEMVGAGVDDVMAQPTPSGARTSGGAK